MSLGAAFYRWFGDSVVVDEKRNPLVVYHGTNADFKKFDLSKSGSRFAEHKTDGAMWFSESPDEANGYVDSVAGGNVMPCYLKMENPAVVDAAKTVQADLYVKLPGGKKVYEIRYIKKRVVQYAKEDGHDGVIFLNGYDNVPSIGALFAVFKASQIKSAIGNDGSWDSDDEDVRSNPKGVKLPSIKSLKKYCDTQECYEYAALIEKDFAGRLEMDSGFYIQSDGVPAEHAWVVAKDGTIIDTTHGQFDPDAPILIARKGAKEYSRYVSWNEHHEPRCLFETIKPYGECELCGAKGREDRF